MKVIKDVITIKPKKTFIKTLSLFLKLIKLPYPAIDVDIRMIPKKKNNYYKNYNLIQNLILFTRFLESN